MSEIRVTSLKDTSGSNSSTTAEIASGRAKAWVNFNGTSTVAIRANFNVNSITDNAIGHYTVNFSTAFTDTNFVVIGTGSQSGVAFGAYLVDFTPEYARTTTSVRVWTGAYNALQDTQHTNVAIFR